MGDIYKPDRVERHRDEDVYSARIERDKKEKQEFSKDDEEGQNKILFNTFFTYLKKLFDQFSTKEKFSAEVIDFVQIIKHLKELKEYFIHLTDSQEISESTQFANKLSTLWISLQDDKKFLELLEGKQKKESYIKNLLMEMQHYSIEHEDQQHSMGHYLDNQVGESWLPFPFVELLKTLYQDYKSHHDTSTLSRWISYIDQGISQLNIRINKQ